MTTLLLLFERAIILPWLIVSFCLSTLLLFTWIETSNEFNGFDWVVFLGTGVWFFWSIVLLSFLGILAAYTTLLLVLGFLLCWEKNQLFLHWYHKVRHLNLHRRPEIRTECASLAPRVKCRASPFFASLRKKQSGYTVSTKISFQQMKLAYQSN
ncbi:glycerophosphodiester phosphodiesterase domain-containing protein 4-like [Bos indicus]|uniref:Glycerophosphodiester phosphodiesterase domain-containing protein 4-like n=1 Tax=Bos indicus TaxID=9915 RepID=A0ABM4RT12_BOSIN